VPPRTRKSPRKLGGLFVYNWDSQTNSLRFVKSPWRVALDSHRASELKGLSCAKSGQSSVSAGNFAYLNKSADHRAPLHTRAYPAEQEPLTQVVRADTAIAPSNGTSETQRGANLALRNP